MLLNEEITDAASLATWNFLPSLKRININKIKNISSNKHGIRLPKRLFPKNVKDKSDIMQSRQNQRQGSVRSCPRRHRVVSRRRGTGKKLTIFIIIVPNKNIWRSSICHLSRENIIRLATKVYAFSGTFHRPSRSDWPVHPQGAHTICLCSRLLFYSKCTGFTVCFAYSDISLTLYTNQW